MCELNSISWYNKDREVAFETWYESPSMFRLELGFLRRR